MLAEELDTEDLRQRWTTHVEEPIQRQGELSAPSLVLLRSPYRLFFDHLLEWLRQLSAASQDRQIIVLIPELVQRRWYQFFISHRAMRLKAQLLLHGGPRIAVMSSPWYSDVAT